MTEKTSDIKQFFDNASINELDDLIAKYSCDSRKIVQGYITKAQKRIDNYNKELLRLEDMKIYENKYNDYAYIAGIDEVGRGPLAGPVVACSVILPKDCNILYINDSKKLSSKLREELAPEIKEKAISYSIGIASMERIDEINILQATYEAMQMAVNNMSVTPDLLLNDAVIIPNLPQKQIKIIHGDAKSISIAAASIVAKVYRDKMMEEYDKIYPEYGFASNKGYGSETHIEAIKKYGPCPIHRNTFIQNFIN